MKKTCFLALSLLIIFVSHAQEPATTGSRPLTMDEYSKAKTYIIKDLDNQTYAKFDNNYILDRYEMRKPYYITGDDGLKKRIDLYKLVAKDGMKELGLLVFYTNEKGKVYTAVQPNFSAPANVWAQYFEDIHAIDKEEKNFVLKLSYVLSKEMSFQLYKAMNNGNVVKDETATYGTDICFPGDELVAMADGTTKMMKAINAGDNISVIDPNTHQSSTATVEKLLQHDAKNYAITNLLVVAATSVETNQGFQVQLQSKVLSATPNHPITTVNGVKNIGSVVVGDQVICEGAYNKSPLVFSVYNTTEVAGGVQKVYNLQVNSGQTMIVNGVMVMQK